MQPLWAPRGVGWGLGLAAVSGVRGHGGLWDVLSARPGTRPLLWLWGHRTHGPHSRAGRQHCRADVPPPPPPCFPSLLSLRPKQACILDTEVGPQHTDWFKEANSPNNSWLRLPEFRPRIIAGGWRAPSVPLRCTAALADLGRGVWRGRSHAPVCSRAFLFLIIGG